MSKLTKAFSADITINEGERAVVARISTSAIDREGDVLVPQGCNAKDFLQNPIVYLNHDYYNAPKSVMGQCASFVRDEIDIVTKTLFAKRPDTLPAENEWLPDTVFSLYQQKVFRGFSVGFEIVESRPATTRDVEKYGDGCRRVISKWKLYEYSVAPMPCNQEALALAVSKGIVTPHQAKGLCDFEPKAGEPVAEPAAVVKSNEDPTMQTCSMCKKEYPADEMIQDGDMWTCAECAKPAKAIEPPETKHVHATIAASEPQAAPVAVKHVHRVIAMTPAPDHSAIIKRLVVAEIGKRKGRFYPN